MNNIIIRPIQPTDNFALAKIIRNALEEFGANHPGTVYFDESTDHISDIFNLKNSAYFIAENDNSELLGGGGIYPTAGLPIGTCELVKMYLAPTARGLGIGKRLMETAIQAALVLGFNQIYLETMPELTSAIPMYEKFGFQFLSASMGNSGHHGCKVWMLKTISQNAESQFGQ